MNLASYIDHTLLKPEATKSQIAKIVEEAKENKFASVCVNPHWVTTTLTKVYETKEAIQNGATEVDMVINIGELKSGNEALVKADIKAVVDAAKEKALTKVIIETALLTDEEKVLACQLAKEAGADFVKTSTGFSGGGATVEDVRLMRQTVGPEMGVKASGGVRDLETTEAMIEAGATRIGASAGVEIVAGKKGTSDY